MTTLKWELVADQLRRELQIGRVGANGELDTEAEMCDRFSVSRSQYDARLRNFELMGSSRRNAARAVRRRQRVVQRPTD
jgi:hypothetical protein